MKAVSQIRELPTPQTQAVAENPVVPSPSPSPLRARASSLALKVRCRRGAIILSIWLFAGIVRHHIGGQDIPAFLTMLATVTLVSFAYIVYFIISEKLYEEMLGSVMISLVLMGLTAIFFPFGILLFIWIVYNLVRTLQSMLGLIIPAVLSLFALALLFPVLVVENTGRELLFLARPLVLVGPLLGDRYEGALTVMDILFMCAGIVYAWRASRVPLKHALMQLSVTAGAVGLLLISLCAVLNGLRSLFETSWISSTRDIRVTQNVSGYTRTASGTVVEAYQREVTRTVVQSVPVTSLGTGSATLGALGAASASIDQANQQSDGKKPSR